MRWPYMGFMGKVKNLFTGEEEVPVEPVKKEVIQVETPAPAEEKKPSPKKEVTVEAEEEKKEEKFSFPVFFDDKDFESLEKPKVEKKKEKKNAPVVKREDAYQAKGIHYEEKKVFKPSPIISPVYGIQIRIIKKRRFLVRRHTRMKVIISHINWILMMYVIKLSELWKMISTLRLRKKISYL